MNTCSNMEFNWFPWKFTTHKFSITCFKFFEFSIRVTPKVNKVSYQSFPRCRRDFPSLLLSIGFLDYIKPSTLEIYTNDRRDIFFNNSVCIFDQYIGLHILTLVKNCQCWTTEEFREIPWTGEMGGLVCRGGDWGSPRPARRVLAVPLGVSGGFYSELFGFSSTKIRLGYQHSLNGLHEYCSWFQWLSWSCTYRFPVQLYIIILHVLLFLVLGVVLLIGGPSTWFPQECKLWAEFPHVQTLETYINPFPGMSVPSKDALFTI